MPERGQEPTEVSREPEDGAPSVRPAPPSLTISTGRTRRFPSVAAIAWLTLVWILLWDSITVGQLLTGIAVGTLVAWAFPLPRVPFDGHFSPLGVVRLFARLSIDIVLASAQVAALALRVRHTPRGAVLRVQLRSASDLYLVLTGDLCSLVPGSLVVEALRTTGTLYIHVLDVTRPGAIEEARQSVLRQEASVLYAIASDTEIAAAGLPPRRFGGPDLRSVAA